MIGKNSPEYRFYEDNGGLDKLVSLCGGIKLDYKSKVFKKMPTTAVKDNDITDFLLVLALLLFMYDIICRRLNISIYDSVSLKFAMNKEKKDKAGPAVKESIKATEIKKEPGNEDKVKEPKKVKKTKEKRPDKKKEEPLKPAGLDTAALLKKQQNRKR